jgi:hypothetical protein
MTLLLKLLAPYLAVAAFWCGLSNAWLAILAYHAQILFWSRAAVPRVRPPLRTCDFFLAVPLALAGPLLFFLLPFIAHADLSTWLESHHLPRLSFLAMIPYFGLVHPFLEQVHWGPLRERTPLAHLAFAGYHLLVLASLLPWGWLVLCFAALTAASHMWRWMARRTAGLAVPIVSHVLADVGVVLAAWWRTSG